jgi:NADH/F420H2 dehydrogenase subunit C
MRETMSFFEFVKNILCLILPNSILKIEENINGDVVVWIRPDQLFLVVSVFKNHTNFNFSLTDILCIDYPEEKERFHLVYSFLSVKHQARIFLKVCVGENAGIDSISSLFSSANWLEREIWDMNGVFFYDHPDLRRILTDYGFKGFPLRKDFPLSGYTEIVYDEKTKQLRYQNVELAQEFRNFDFISPWEDKKKK